jgi:hypothetical protein
MEYVTTFSVQLPHEKTELAPSGAPVNVAEPVKNTALDAFFRGAPFYAYQGNQFGPGEPKPLADDFHRILELAKNT